MEFSKTASYSLLFAVLSSSAHALEIAAETNETVTSDYENSPWRWNTILVFVVVAIWVLVNVIAIAFSIPKLIEDRRIKKEKISARRRALSFKNKDPHTFEKEHLLKPQGTHEDWDNISRDKPPSYRMHSPSSRVSSQYDNVDPMDSYNPRPATNARRYAPEALNQHLDRISGNPQIDSNYHLAQVNNYYQDKYYPTEDDGDYTEAYDEPPSLQLDPNAESLFQPGSRVPYHY
ncbi:hypothetical protein Ciccas_004361 [Cichlidogyrus casuarinus]|uniref:Uncharacterized protein n=1 Tax=Cichlidogyrus casuarinus TaxID=1844966 RepID=A0ABD2QBP6_9PLAT